MTGLGSSYVQTLFSNRVVVGTSEFDDNGLVSVIEFCPTSPFVSIFHRSHSTHGDLDPHTPIAPESLFAERVHSGSVSVHAIDSDRLEACSVSLADMVVSLRATRSVLSNIQGTRTEEGRRARIHFPEPVDMQRAIHEVTRLCRFFTLIVGEEISATDVKVLGVSDDAPDREFDLHLNFPVPPREISPDKAHRCLISIPFEGERYGQVLKQWFERAAIWDVSYSLMYQAIAERNHIGRNRYLNSVAWFESIPMFYLHKEELINRSDLDGAVKAAASVLNARGELVSHARLTGLIAQLNQPSLAIRLRSAVKFLKVHFGENSIPASVESAISQIVSIRSGYAHGGNPETEYPLDEIYLGASAAEYICFLLTLSQGSWTFDLLDRAFGHPLRNAKAWLEQLPVQRDAPTTPGPH